VDGEVHGAVAELEEAETGLKDGRTGPSAWRHLVADGEPAVEAGTGGRGGRRLGRGAVRRYTRARGWVRMVEEGLERGVYGGLVMMSTAMFGAAQER
jgi:hypothetical protein